ncbi:MAG TPA: hypothetical protein VM943_11575 [Pyrinomonadaceae bacterium]|nr:hypothetical protein [Pyrinomonadaceae bacterium]
MNLTTSFFDDDACGLPLAASFLDEQAGGEPPPTFDDTFPLFQKPIADLLTRIESPALRNAMERIFSDMARLLGYLNIIETDLHQGRAGEETLSVFALVRGESLALLDFIETHALYLTESPEEVRDVLDGTGYAVGLELRQVYEGELDGLHDIKQESQAHAKLGRAHGLLHNCFQQSTIALGRVFDPALDGATLFDDLQSRREQSLALYEDLRTLIEIVRRAEVADSYSESSLLESLINFLGGSMRYLMFKDWDVYEHFVEQIMDASTNAERAPVLHRLGCYLETLLGQVRMRAVLSDCISATSTASAEFAAAAGRF